MSLFAHVNGLIIDLFAGGGGASLGVERAMGRHVDLGLNHSEDALRNHALNHPQTHHIRDDIRDVVPLEATGGQPVDVLWASPDCKHFSRCKGGKPLDESVRTLPWEVVRWARETRPRLICIENVPEMKTWGPLDAKGYRIREASGATFAEWLQSFRDLGYDVTVGELRACDFGSPTSRKRLIVVCRLDGPATLPTPTHGPGLLPFRTAAECIDWSDLGRSIFDENGEPRHAPATCRRIATGVVKFVLQAKKPFIVGVGGASGRGGAVTSWAADQPLGTVTTKNDRALVVPTLVHIGNGERAGQAPRIYDIQQPLGTVVAGGTKHALVSAFLAKHYGGAIGSDVRVPMGTITAVDHHSLVAAHLTKFYGTSTGSHAGAPMPTITGDAGGGHMGLVAAFLTTYYGQSVGRAVDEPMGTITTRDRHGLVTVEIDSVTYAVTDICLRMVQPHELQLAQGLPASYRLEGTKRLKVRLIGNSVPPQMAEATVRANTPRVTAEAA